MKKVILLTACVNPNGMALTALQDTDERLKQYEDALKWYLDNTDLPVLFVENTECDLSLKYQSLIEEGRLEMLTFRGNDYPRELGKGFGEAKILEYALKHSKLLDNADSVIKITGRLICSNVNTIIRKCKRPDTVMGLVIKDRWGRMQIKSQVVVLPVKFILNYFLPSSNKLNDGEKYWFEHLLWDASEKWQKDGYRFKEFVYLPKIKGQSGSMGIMYTNSLWDIVMQPIRTFVHSHFHYYDALNPAWLFRRTK